MPLRGDAAIIHTADSGAETVHRLNNRLKLTGIRQRQTRYVRQPINAAAAPLVRTVGSVAWEWESRVRFDALPISLFATLKFGANGGTLTYWPSLSGSVSYDVHLIWPENAIALAPDEARFAFGEYETRIVLRRTDGGAIEGLPGTSGLYSILTGGGDLTDWTFDRNSTAFRRTKDGTLESLAADIARTNWGADGVPRTLLELARTNLINTSDLRKFIGWTELGGASVTLTQGQDIAAADDAPGVDGLATRIESSGGTSALKYQIIHGTQTGDFSGSVLVHNQGANAIVVGLSIGSAGVPDVTVAAGATALIESSASPSSESLRFTFATTSAAHDIDCIAFGPQTEAGESPTTFTGIDQTTRAVEVLSRAMPAGLEKPNATFARYTRWKARMDGDGGITQPIITQIGDGDPSTATAAALRLYFNTGGFVLRQGNGSASKVDTLAQNPASGEVVEALILKNSDMTVTAIIAIEQVIVGTLDLAALTPASAWNGGANTYVNSRDGGSNAGAMELEVDAFLEIPAGADAEAKMERARRHPAIRQAA